MKASCVEALDRCEAAALGEAEDEDAARVVHEGRKRLTDALGQLPGGLLHFDELSVRADGAQAAHDFGEQLVRILHDARSFFAGFCRKCTKSCGKCTRELTKPA